MPRKKTVAQSAVEVENENENENEDEGHDDDTVMLSPVYAVDWAHEKKNTAVYDGHKFRQSLPKPERMAAAGSVVATENMPLLKAREYLDAGVPIVCLNTWDVKKERDRQGIEKSHKADARVIFEIYRDTPEKFRPFQIDPDIIRVRSLYATYKDIQEERKRAENRHLAYRDAISMEKVQRAKQEEREYERKLDEEAERWPVYRDWFKGQLGCGASSTIGLIAVIGDPSRFRTVGSLWAYFGLHVVDGKAPRRTKGVVANWSQRGRSHVLGSMKMPFFSHKPDWFERPENRSNKYVQIFLREREKQIPRVEEQFPDLKPKQQSGRAYARACRKAMKSLLKDFFLAYKQLGGCHPPLEALLQSAVAELPTPEEGVGDVHDEFENLHRDDEPTSPPRHELGDHHTSRENRPPRVVAELTIQEGVVGDVLNSHANLPVCDNPTPPPHQLRVVSTDGSRRRPRSKPDEVAAKTSPARKPRQRAPVAAGV